MTPTVPGPSTPAPAGPFDHHYVASRPDGTGPCARCARSAGDLIHRSGIGQ